jgi:hypothetical protein
MESSGPTNPAVAMASKALRQQREDGQAAVALINSAAVQPPPNVSSTSAPFTGTNRGTMVNTYV